MRASALLGPAAAALTLTACAAYPVPTVQPRVTPLPTRVERITPTTVATPVTPSPSPQPTARRVLTAGDVDPYAALYVGEREGSYVTTRRPDGRYYYRSDDRRWYALADRVWFRDVEDLKTVFPNRVPAP
jgi:hypothetical protein